MAEENISQEFRLKNIDETRNYLTEKINWSTQKVCATLNYMEHFLILASTIIECVSTSSFPSIVGIPIGTGLQ